MLIFSHRGASGVEPENTLRAIHATLNAEVDGIEVDDINAMQSLNVDEI